MLQPKVYVKLNRQIGEQKEFVSIMRKNTMLITNAKTQTLCLNDWARNNGEQIIEGEVKLKVYASMY